MIKGTLVRTCLTGLALSVVLTTTGCARRGQYQAAAFSPTRWLQAKVPTFNRSAGQGMIAGAQQTIMNGAQQTIISGANDFVSPQVNTVAQQVMGVSASPKKGVFKFLPTFRRKDASAVQQGAWPSEGAVLTEEQFNALPGAVMNGLMSPGTQQSYPTTSAPVQQMPSQLVPSPEYQLPAANHQTMLQRPQMQPAMGPGMVRPGHVQSNQQLQVRTVSSERTVPSPRQPIGNGDFGNQMSMNFAGAWGNRVYTAPTAAGSDTIAAQPLAASSANESYEMWPSATKPRTASAMMDSTVMAVAGQSSFEAATELLPVTTQRPVSAAMPMISPRQ